MKKKAMALILVAAMAVGLLSGCGGGSKNTETTPENASQSEENQGMDGQESDSGTGSEEKFTIGFAMKSGADAFTSLQAQLFEKVAKEEYPMFEVEVLDCEFDSAKQINVIENFITQGVDLIVLQVTDNVVVLPAIDQAQEAGIPVFALLNYIGDDWSVSIGTEPYNQGVILGEYAAKKLPENAKCVYIQGEIGNEYADGRENGTKDKLKELRPDIEWIATDTANWMRADAMALMEDWLQAFDDIDAVFGADDSTCIGAILACEAANRLDEIQCYGINGDPEGVYYIEQGKMMASVYQSGEAMDRIALDLAVKLLTEGEEIDKGPYLAENELIATEVGTVEPLKQVYIDAGVWYEQ